MANARLAYQVYEELFSTERWALLAEAGALPQRPLWASTGVKDPAYPDTLYVTELVAPGVVNTMPEKTLDATFDHGTVTGNTVTRGYDDANATLNALDALGISYNDVVAVLESEGLDKFVASWKELLGDVEGALAAARKDCLVPMTTLSYDATGAARLAHEQHLPALLEDRIATRIFAKDATLWGPDAEQESAVRLGWVEAATVSQPLVARASWNSATR